MLHVPLIPPKAAPSTLSINVATKASSTHVATTLIKDSSTMSFREIVLLASRWRDHMHDDLYPHDHRSIGSRTTGELRYWFRTRGPTASSLDLALPPIEPVLNSMELMQAFSVLNTIKPFATSKMCDKSQLHDFRAWEIFQSYNFSTSALCVDILRSRRSPNLVDDPDLPCSDPGTPFERVLYLLYLGKLTHPHGVGGPSSSLNNHHMCASFNPSFNHFLRVAIATQAIARSWSLVARIFGFNSIEALSSPYVIFNNKTYLLHPLSRSEGFAPRTQSNSFECNNSSTMNPDLTYPGVTERSPQLDRCLRSVVETFLEDLSIHILSDSLFGARMASWSGFSFFLPSKNTVLPRRFDDLIPIFNAFQKICGRGVLQPLYSCTLSVPLSPDMNNCTEGFPQSSPTTPTPQWPNLSSSQDHVGQQQQTLNTSGPITSANNVKRSLLTNGGALDFEHPISTSNVTPPDADESPDANAGLKPNLNFDSVARKSPEELSSTRKLNSVKSPTVNRRTFGLKRKRTELFADDEGAQRDSIAQVMPDLVLTGSMPEEDQGEPVKLEPNTKAFCTQQPSSSILDKEKNCAGHSESKRRWTGLSAERVVAKRDSNGQAIADIVTTGSERKEGQDILANPEPNIKVLCAQRLSPSYADNANICSVDVQTSDDEIQENFSTSIFSERKDGTACGIKRTERKIRFVERPPAENVSYVSLPPLSIPPMCVMKFLSSFWYWPTFSSEYAHKATHLWPTEVFQKFVDNDMDAILATESVACGVYVAPSKVNEGSLGIYAGKMFGTGDVICNYYGLLAYEYENSDGSDAGVSIGSDELSLLSSSVENFGVGLPRIVSNMTIKNDICVKRAYVVPFEGCVASRIVHPFKIRRKCVEFSKVMNARCERRRNGCGIRRLYELCETNAITVVASRCIKIDEEICLALNRFQDVPEKKKSKCSTSPAEDDSDSESLSTVDEAHQQDK